ncbi:hypothetical protein Tco_0879802 [Tanacetum coccineum]
MINSSATKPAPKVHENLKLITDGRVIDNKPESHSGSIFNREILCVAWPRDPVKIKNPEKSPKEISKPKRNKDEEKLIQLLHQGQLTKNTANYRLYHALMEALITDEDAMDKEVADKDQTRVGQQRKRSLILPAFLGLLKPPPKDDDQSSKKPRESEASASKQHPALTSTGWQITDTREAGDEGNDSDMEDTDNAHIPKVSTTTWFKPIPESERPATPEPEWTIPPNDFPEPEHNWANAYATTYKVPEENKLQRKTYDIGSFIKWFCRRTGKKKLCKADLEGPAFNLVKAFHKNMRLFNNQMDECHILHDK